MKATEALRSGVPLIIEIGDDNRRVIADLFEINGTWVFADIGWADPWNSGHPFHVISEPTGEGPWSGDGYRIIENARDDELWEEHQEWLTHVDRLGATTELAKDRAAQSLGL